VWPLAHPVPFGYDSCAMLSRAQEARVRALLWSSPAGTVQTYCLEHLAAAAGGRSCRLSSQMMIVRDSARNEYRLFFMTEESEDSFFDFPDES
jgi:hypothetical protein